LSEDRRHKPRGASCGFFSGCEESERLPWRLLSGRHAYRPPLRPNATSSLWITAICCIFLQHHPRCHSHSHFGTRDRRDAEAATIEQLLLKAYNKANSILNGTNIKLRKPGFRAKRRYLKSEAAGSLRLVRSFTVPPLEKSLDGRRNPLAFWNSTRRTARIAPLLVED
jgi:hypothetical protein